MGAIDVLEVGNAEDDKLSVTLRGDAAEIMKVLVNGLPREALLQIEDAIKRELVARGV